MVYSELQIKGLGRQMCQEKDIDINFTQSYRPVRDFKNLARKKKEMELLMYSVTDQRTGQTTDARKLRWIYGDTDHKTGQTASARSKNLAAKGKEEKRRISYQWHEKLMDFLLTQSYRPTERCEK